MVDMADSRREINSIALYNQFQENWVAIIPRILRMGYDTLLLNTIKRVK